MRALECLAEINGEEEFERLQDDWSEVRFDSTKEIELKLYPLCDVFSLFWNNDKAVCSGKTADHMRALADSRSHR